MLEVAYGLTDICISFCSYGEQNRGPSLGVILNWSTELQAHPDCRWLKHLSLWNPRCRVEIQLDSLFSELWATEFRANMKIRQCLKPIKQNIFRLFIILTQTICHRSTKTQRTVIEIKCMWSSSTEKWGQFSSVNWTHFLTNPRWNIISFFLPGFKDLLYTLAPETWCKRWVAHSELVFLTKRSYLWHL